MRYKVNLQLTDLISFFKKNIRFNIKYFLLAFLISLIAYFTTPRMYKSTASILSSNSIVSDSGGLGSLVNQFGINLDSSPNPLFNPEVLKKMIKTEETLEKILLQTVLVDGKNLKIFEHLFNDYDINNVEDFALGKQNFKNNIINIYKELKSPIINLLVETNNPDLSYAICEIVYNETISVINARNQQKNFTKLSFYDMRIKEIESHVKIAQEDLIRFRVENRNYASSVQLSQIYENKKIELDMRKSIFLDLRIKKESLEIENKNETTSLFLIEEPTMPVLKSYPTKGLFVLIMLILHLPLLVWYIWRFTKLDYDS
jgi:capsule polysaccharide export protein KpsE/RkpR